MANDGRPSRKVSDDGNIKGKKKDTSPASISGSADASGLRRSGREKPSRKQKPASPSNTRKSERIEKQTPPNTPLIKKKPERIEKQMGASPLRRSDRGKKHLSPGSSGSKKSVELPTSSNNKSRKEKVVSSSKQSAVDVSEDNKNERQDPDVGGWKRKRMTACGYKALFKRQRIRIEADDDKDPEGQGKSPEANTSSNGDVDKELKRPAKLTRLYNNKRGCSLEGRDEGVGKCSDRVGEKCFLKAAERPSGTSYSSLQNLDVEEIDDQFVTGKSDCKRRIGFTEGHKVSLNSRRVQGAPDKAQKVLLDERLMDLDQVEHVGCPSHTKPLDGKSTESGNAAKQIGGNCSSSNRKMSTRNMDFDSCADSDNHISHTSPSSGCKKHDYDETCLACSKKQRCCAAVGCNRCYHLSCLDPPVDNLPLGIWHCSVCVKNIKSSVPSVSRVAESIWDTREVEVSDAEGLQKQKQYFVKYKGVAHIHNEWVTEAQLLIEAPLLVENFNNNDSWNNAWTVPHQLLKKRLLLSFKPLNESQEAAGKVLSYHYEWLVKWQGLDSGQATWELESGSVLGSPKGQNLIKEYENHHGKTGISASTVDKTKEPSVKSPTIPAGGLLGMDQIHLSYVKKLHDSWTKGQSRVVFDNQERTMRIVLFILSLKDVTQPFLIITTSGSLSQWEAMFLRVAPSNDFKVSIEDRGTQRSVILLEAQKEGGQQVFQVLLYPVDAFVEDLHMLKNINWKAIMVDESQCSEISTRFNDIKCLSTDKRLLLFGGPLGESTAEYLNVLSLLGCDGALSNNTRSKTESDDSLGKLKETLSRYIAYECKSDSSKFVEFWVPVQISNLQLEQYCATLLSSAMALRSCSKSDTVGALHDILISNRKCCNHPYIVDPLLQAMIMKDHEATMFLDVGIKASGKLQFLDLILPEVKKRQLRVLILFQPTGGTGRGFASVGDILDDFVRQRFGQDSYERVDGVGIVPSKKQAALNNFNKDMSRFIFLLDYRACLSSIKLSSVDIIVIFDSDLNPANDLRALQKISIDSQSEQIMIFRLYSPCTLEEKILRLAEHNVAIESKCQNLSRSTCDALLMWGASDLFNKLSEFHSESVLNISSEESFLKDLLEEFLYLISHKFKSKDTAKSIITRVQSCGTYGKNLPLHSETKTQLPDGEQPHIFWRKLLEGRYPQWKFVSVSTPRQRKRPHYFEDSSKETSASAADVGKKRKKTVNNSIEPAASKIVIEGETGGANEGASGVPAHNESQSSSGDCFWSTAVRNEGNIHHLLKPTVSELCKVLKFSEDVKIIVEIFLEFVLENYQVSKEHTSTLQAFMISLCWIGSSLSKYKIDRRESFILAKKHLNFSCMEEEVNSVYSKLESAKEMFLQHTRNQEERDALKDFIPAPQATCTEPIGVKLEIVERQHNQNVDVKKFNRDWNEKRMHLENDYKLDKALIRTLHSNPSVRSEKLKSLEKEFANKLEEHERMREIHLKDLKTMQLAAEGQLAANHNSSFSECRAANELSLHDSQHDNKMVCSGDSKQGAQDSPKASPTSSGNLLEVQSHDKSVQDMHPTLVVPADIRTETSISLENPDGGSHKVNAMSLELVGPRIEDQPKQGGSLGTGTNIVEANVMIFEEGPGTTTAEPLNRVGNSRDSANNIESTSSHTSEKQMADATVSSLPIGEIPAQQHEGIDNNVVGHVDSVATGVPEVDSNKENAKGGTSSPAASHTVKDRNETGPNDMALHVDSTGMGMPAANCNKENTEDSIISPDTSHAIEDQNDSCGSSSSNSPSAAASQEKTPSVQLFASPASDHSMPTVLEIQNESLQLQQLPYSGNQDKEGQAIPSSLTDIDVDNLQPVDARQVGQINSEGSSLEPHVEPSFPLSTNPPIAENQSDILPASGLLLETSEEPILTCFSGGPSQAAENHTNPSNHTVLQSRGNLEQHPLVTAETSLGEHQPHLPSSDAVHDQPSVELHNSAQNPEVSAPPLTAEIPNQSASLPELNMFDVQGSNNHNQVPTRMPNQADPLQAELERLCAVKDTVIKFHEDNKQRLKSECEKEITEIIAQISLKYEAKRQDAEAAFHLKKKELDIILNRVVMNKILAEAFRSKCQDLTPGHAGMQQVTQAGLMQQLHRFSILPSIRRSGGVASSSPGQSSGNQQTPTPTPTPPPPPPPPPPPLQIVHQPAALFSSRPPPNTNLRSPSSSPSRPPPSINPVTSNSLSTRPLPTINPITPSSMPTRPPPSINPISPSSTPNRPPPSINPITPSASNLRVNSETRAPAPHIRPLVNSETRAPAPHIRPLVSSEFRAPAPHIRPFRPSASVSHDFASHRRMLPSQHVTSSLPPTSPINSQVAALPPLSTSLIQPPTAPLPPEASTVPPAPVSAQTPSSASSWPPSQSQLPQPPPPQASHQSPPPPSLLAHRSALASQQHPPSSLLATSSSLPHSSSHTPLPQIPTSQTGFFSASLRPESGGPPLPTPDNLNSPALNLLTDIAACRHRPNVLTPPLDLSFNFDSLDLTGFGREGGAHSSSGHDLVCLSDDD